MELFFYYLTRSEKVIELIKPECLGVIGNLLPTILLEYLLIISLQKAELLLNVTELTKHVLFINLLTLVI